MCQKRPSSPLWRGSAGAEFSVAGVGAKLLARYGALIDSAFREPGRSGSILLHKPKRAF
jgi:hypothetical protein